MKKLLGFENISELISGRLSQSEFDFLMKNIITRNKVASAQTPAIEIKPSSKNSKRSEKGNVLGDSKNRWETVYFHHGKHWKIKARISQKEGLEITQALFKSTRTGFANQKIYPLGFAVKRSYCKLGPFLVHHCDGFSVNAFYSIRDANHFLIQGHFRDDGACTTRLVESKPSKKQLRVITKIAASNPVIFDSHGIELKPDSMPILSNRLQCDSAKPYFEFSYLDRACQAFPPSNSRWQFSLTNNTPCHNKGIPSTKICQSINYQKPIFFVVQSNSSIESAENLGSILLFTDRFTRIG